MSISRLNDVNYKFRNLLYNEVKLIDVILIHDYKVYKKSSKNLHICVFAQIFCLHFNEYAKINLRNTTYERLLQLRGRIYPAIGHLRMDKITPRHIQAFVNSLSQEGANERTGKPLAPKTIRHNLSFISNIFTYAAKMGVVSDNPCSKVTILKNEVKEKQIYTPEEVEKFLTLLNDEPLKYRTFFYLMIYSGFRRGEMLGLDRWVETDRLYVKWDG